MHTYTDNTDSHNIHLSLLERKYIHTTFYHQTERTTGNSELSRKASDAHMDFDRLSLSNCTIVTHVI